MRTAAVFAAMLLASAVAAPSVVAFHEATNVGKTGEYTVPDYNDQPGVACRYENNPGELRDEIDRIAVKKMWSHGPYAQKTWVGQRILIKKNAKPFNDGKFKIVWRSPIVKGKANEAEPFFFPARGWQAPEGSRAQYRVQIIFNYYQPGSKTKVVGQVRGLEEVYGHKMKGAPQVIVGSEGVLGNGVLGSCAPRFAFDT